MIKRFAVLATLVLAVGAAVGTYFAVRGSQAVLPKNERSALLESAKAHGLIRSYGIRKRGLYDYARDYEVDGQVFVEYGLTGPCANHPCPFQVGPMPFVIEYYPAASTEARAILELADRRGLRALMVECKPC